MKIKLLINVPVDKRHGMTEGRILDVIEYEQAQYKKRGSGGYWVMGDMGEKVKILKHECEEIE